MPTPKSFAAFTILTNAILVFSLSVAFSQETGWISGSNVNLRNSSSTDSKVIGRLNKYEVVEILGIYSPSGNWDEAIVKDPKGIQLYDDYGNKAMRLYKGKAVKILSNDDNKCKVSFTEGRSKYTATVSKYSLESIGGEDWYNIRKRNGQVGWVFGRYVEAGVCKD